MRTAAQLVGGPQAPPVRYSEGEWFAWDFVRSKWLSFSTVAYEAGAGAAATDDYLLFCIGGRQSSTFGHHSPFALTLIGLEYTTTTASGDGTYEVEVRADGTSAYDWIVGTAANDSIGELDVDFDAGDIISFFMDGTGGGAMNLVGHFKRRAAF